MIRKWAILLRKCNLWRSDRDFSGICFVRSMHEIKVITQIMLTNSAEDQSRL